MNNDETILRKSVVDKVLEVAQRCVDEKRKGWRDCRCSVRRWSRRPRETGRSVGSEAVDY
jgi:hypothetical protein